MPTSRRNTPLAPPLRFAAGRGLNLLLALALLLAVFAAGGLNALATGPEAITGSHHPGGHESYRIDYAVSIDPGTGYVIVDTVAHNDGWYYSYEADLYFRLTDAKGNVLATSPVFHYEVDNSRERLVGGFEMNLDQIKRVRHVHVFEVSRPKYPSEWGYSPAPLGPAVPLARLLLWLLEHGPLA